MIGLHTAHFQKKMIHLIENQVGILLMSNKISR